MSFLPEQNKYKAQESEKSKQIRQARGLQTGPGSALPCQMNKDCAFYYTFTFQISCMMSLMTQANPELSREGIWETQFQLS